MDKTNLTNGHVLNTLLWYSLPLLVANLLQGCYSIVDMIVVGYYTGDSGIAAVSNASSLIFVLTAFSIGLSMGGTVIVARYKGAGDKLGQKDTVSNVLLVMLVVAVLVTALCIAFHKQLFLLMGTPVEALADASAYMTTIAWGTVFLFGYNAVCGIMRGVGDSWRVLYFVAIAALMNVFLDILFVGQAGHGVQGAALATVISQGFAFLLAFRHLHKQLGLQLSFNKNKLKSILSIGIPTSVQLVVINISFLIVTAMYNQLGVASTVAAGIGIKIATLIALPCWAVGQAVTAIAGQNMGAGNIMRAEHTLKAGLLVNLVMMTVFTIFLQVFARDCVMIFSPDSKEAADAGVLYLRLFCGVNNLVYVVKYTCDAFMTGTGAAKLAMANAILDSIVIRLFLSWLIAFHMGYGFAGICIAQAVAPILPMLMGIWYWRSRRWSNTDVA